jgi:hypothetical protein
MTPAMRAVFALVLVSGACGGTQTGPSPAPAPVQVTIAQNPTFTGDSLVFSIRVDNISPAAVDLTFPSSCLVLPYFVDRRTGQPVTPVGGGFGCATVIVHKRLAPGEFYAQSFSVKAAGGPPDGLIVLPPGDYSIYGRLEDSSYRAQSNSLPFSVK